MTRDTPFSENLPDGFEVMIADDPDYEKLIAEIYFQGEFLAILSQERGSELLEVKLYPRKSGEAWSFLVSDLNTVLEEAMRRLLGK